MYSIVIAALLLFPWSAVIVIAFGTLRAARRRAIASKRTQAGSVMKRLGTMSKAVSSVGVAALVLAGITISMPAEAHAPGVVLSGIGTATIDGVFARGEWDTADRIDFLTNVPAPGRVDAATLTSGRTGDEPSLIRCNSRPKDVNHDRLPDLVRRSDTQTAGFQHDDTLGILKGQTGEGTPIIGTDAVQIVP